MTTWMLSVDQQLVNLVAVAYIDVMDVYPEEIDSQTVDSGSVTPAYTELVAHLASGEEVVLFDDEEPEVVVHAFDLLKQHLSSPASHDPAFGRQILSVQDLIDRAGAQKN
jgi:hypothetical protein